LPVAHEDFESIFVKQWPRTGVAKSI